MFLCVVSCLFEAKHEVNDFHVFCYACRLSAFLLQGASGRAGPKKKHFTKTLQNKRIADPPARVRLLFGFVKGSSFRPLQARISCRPTKTVRTFAWELQRVRAFGHALAKHSEGFALLANTCKWFALFGTCWPEP